MTKRELVNLVEDLRDLLQEFASLHPVLAADLGENAPPWVLGFDNEKAKAERDRETRRLADAMFAGLERLRCEL